MTVALASVLRDDVPGAVDLPVVFAIAAVRVFALVVSRSVVPARVLGVVPVVLLVGVLSGVLIAVLALVLEMVLALEILLAHRLALALVLVSSPHSILEGVLTLVLYEVLPVVLRAELAIVLPTMSTCTVMGNPIPTSHATSQTARWRRCVRGTPDSSNADWLHLRSRMTSACLDRTARASRWRSLAARWKGRPRRR